MSETIGGLGVQHLVDPQADDATICGEFIDSTDRDWEQDRLSPGVAPVTCRWCLAEMQNRTMENAREFVANELGVSIDEID